MKKYFTGLAFLAVTLCFPIVSTASFLFKKQPFHLENPINGSDSDGLVWSELMTAEVSKSVNLGFNQKRLSTFGFLSSPFTETPNSTLNLEFQRPSVYRYNENSNKIKIGLSPITTVLEFHFNIPDGGQRFRRAYDSENYWIAQLGFHPLWINQLFLGLKRGYVINHFEAGFGVAFSTVSQVLFGSLLFPTFNVGFTTLGLNSKLRFNCGIGLPEIIYVGTSYSL